jgi:hypothetical protein
MTVRTDEAYARLTEAMMTVDPACQRDDRFISDDTAHDAVLAAVCAICPLFYVCAEYGRIARPKGGLWAGKRYKSNGPQRLGSTTERNTNV